MNLGQCQVLNAFTFPFPLQNKRFSHFVATLYPVPEEFLIQQVPSESSQLGQSWFGRRLERTVFVRIAGCLYTFSVYS